MRASPASIIQQPLDHLLGTKALVRVLRVLTEHGGSLAVSDIAQRSKLTQPSVRAALRRLLEIDAISAIGAGRSMVCAFRTDFFLAPALSALFSAERDQANALLRGVRAAAARLNPKPLAVWLYGSAARGEDVVTSDIDIALISRSDTPSEQADKLRHTLAMNLPAWGDRIAVVSMSQADARRLARQHDRFWKEMERDAVVLLGDSPKDVAASSTRGKKH